MHRGRISRAGSRARIQALRRRLTKTNPMTPLAQPNTTAAAQWEIESRIGGRTDDDAMAELEEIHMRGGLPRIR